MIDHHATNPGFGQLNSVHPERAATCEMLPDLFAKLGVIVTPELAKALYTGLYTDTGRLRYANVSARTRELAADLGEVMGDGGQAVRDAVEDWPQSWRDYAARGIARARMLDEDVLVSVLDASDLAECGVGDRAYKEAATIAIDLLQDLPASFYIQVYEIPDGSRSVSVRCPDEHVHAGEIARTLGGGGHPAAAGLTTKLPAAEIAAALYAEYRRLRDSAPVAAALSG
jgi:phosphoesterase RecJ-like protein